MANAGGGAVGVAGGRHGLAFCTPCIMQARDRLLSDLHTPMAAGKSG